MFRFLHASDLHLGKRFGNYPEDLRGRLREARHGAIGRLAAAARAHGASHVLLAGDTFDTETPTPAILRQALAEMAGHAPLVFVLLPGNHDSLLADQLWRAVGDARPANVLLALADGVVSLAPDVALLPAPCTARRPGRDLTAWMQQAETAAGTLRIGLAHGPIQTFSEEGSATDVIAPNRADLADLDYLALGDWHGQLEITPRTWYSGTPEPDRFKHGRSGSALGVAIAGPGARPEVVPCPTGTFEWPTLALDLFDSDDPLALLAAGWPGGPRRQTLLRVTLSGRTSLARRTALLAALDAAEPDFAWLERDLTGLATTCEATDLDLIARHGALRAAADALLEESEDAARSERDRVVAREALARLFSLAEATAT